MIGIMTGECVCVRVCVCVLVTQLCPTLCESMDCSLPGHPVHEILQVRGGRRYFNGKTKITFGFFQEKSGGVSTEAHFLTEIDLKIT